MESLNGKLALVTGGTRGIGRAIAEKLAREGARVALCGREKESSEAAAREIFPDGTVRGFAADVSKPQDVSALFRAVDEAFGGLDILVNNAGVGVFRKVGEMSVEDWHRNIDLNLNGAFYCTREAVERMRKRGGGFIVNISSLAARNPFSGGAAYNASKFALNGFTEALMLDHRYDGIRVTSIMPGSVATEFSGPGKSPGADEWKVASEDVAEAVAMVLKMPARTMVSRVELRPSQPRK